MADLSVSQRDYQRSLEDLKQEQEQKLNDVRAGYQKRKVDEQEAGDAAVNHIKRNSEERLEQVRTSSDQKLKSESENANKSYSDLRRRANVQAEVSREHVQEAEAKEQEDVTATRKDETHAIKQTQKRLSEFMENQNELRHQARESTSQDIEKDQKRGAEKIMENRERNQKELAKMNKESHQNLERLKAHDDGFFETTRERGEDRLERLKATDEAQITREQHEKNNLVSDLAHKYQDETGALKHDGDRRLEVIRKDEEKKFATERARFARVNENSSAEYSNESRRIQREGQEDIRAQNTKYEELKKTQMADQAARLKEFDGDLNSKEGLERQARIDKMQIEAKTFDRQMRTQRTEFAKRYDSSGKANAESLTTQKEGYLAALYKQKQKFDSSFSGNSERSDDPFYRLKTFSPSLHDKEGSYVLYAKVEPYEKDNVDVFVKDDRITLSAKRAFGDAFADKNGERTTTNSFQTYRQEFKLEMPVDSKKAYTKIDDDGTINVIVPKKGAYDASKA